MAGKQITLIYYSQHHVRSDWEYDLHSKEHCSMIDELSAELAGCGINLTTRDEPGFIIDIRSYADLLNAIRITSHDDGFSNICIGHVIGKSINLNLSEDIRRAVARVAYAPETVPPDDHNRKVCHNCGCGC